MRDAELKTLGSNLQTLTQVPVEKVVIKEVPVQVEKKVALN